MTKTIASIDSEEECYPVYNIPNDRLCDWCKKNKGTLCYNGDRPVWTPEDVYTQLLCSECVNWEACTCCKFLSGGGICRHCRHELV